MIDRKTSEELLGESIIEPSRNKPLDKITVKEIAEFLLPVDPPAWSGTAF